MADAAMTADGSILPVDDEYDTLSSPEGLFLDSGGSPLTAGSGEEALELGQSTEER
jgi:hypothetical protein